MQSTDMSSFGTKKSHLINPPYLKVELKKWKFTSGGGDFNLTAGERERLVSSSSYRKRNQWLVSLRFNSVDWCSEWLGSSCVMLVRRLDLYIFLANFYLFIM